MKKSLFTLLALMMSTASYSKETVLDCTGTYKVCTEYHNLTRCPIPKNTIRGIFIIDGKSVINEEYDFLSFKNQCLETDSTKISCSIFGGSSVIKEGDTQASRILTISRMTGELNYTHFSGISQDSPNYYNGRRGDKVTYIAQCTPRANKRLF